MTCLAMPFIADGKHIAAGGIRLVAESATLRAQAIERLLDAAGFARQVQMDLVVETNRARVRRLAAQKRELGMMGEIGDRLQLGIGPFILWLGVTVGTLALTNAGEKTAAAVLL